MVGFGWLFLSRIPRRCSLEVANSELLTPENVQRAQKGSHIIFLCHHFSGVNSLLNVWGCMLDKLVKSNEKVVLAIGSCLIDFEGE